MVSVATISLWWQHGPCIKLGLLNVITVLVVVIIIYVLMVIKNGNMQRENCIGGVVGHLFMRLLHVLSLCVRVKERVHV